MIGETDIWDDTRPVGLFLKSERYKDNFSKKRKSPRSGGINFLKIIIKYFVNKIL